MLVFYVFEDKCNGFLKEISKALGRQLQTVVTSSFPTQYLSYSLLEDYNELIKFIYTSQFTKDIFGRNCNVYSQCKPVT